MSINIRNKTILNVAGISVFTAMFCMGCYDLGLEPSVKTPTVETFVDHRDGHVYKKVKIGEQTWMAENLKYEAEGSACYDEGREGEAWARDPKQMCEAYGRLYDWYTAMNGEHSSSANPSGIEGVCPVGWHLPSDEEWRELTRYVGIHSGTKLKSHEYHRNSQTQTPEGTDLYNFSALPGGYGTKRNDGAINGQHLQQTGYWWTTTELETDSEQIWVRQLYEVGAEMVTYHMNKHYFMSVRCVHDYD